MSKNFCKVQHIYILIYVLVRIVSIQSSGKERQNTSDLICKGQIELQIFNHVNFLNYINKFQMLFSWLSILQIVTQSWRLLNDRNKVLAKNTISVAVEMYI